MSEKRFLLLFVLAITAVFVAMIRPFLIALTLAALFAGLLRPAYEWLLPRFRNQRGLTAATVLLVVLLLIIIPLVLFMGMVASQAVSFTEQVQPWVLNQVQNPNQL